MCERVSKRKSRIARTRANAILNEVRKKLKDEYKFTTRLVGSATRNTIVKDGEGKYDLDYQILLTHNSKSSLAANDVKNRFMTIFEKVTEDYEDETIYNSTTAITLINSQHNFSIDFVILKILNDPGLIIRRANNTDDPSVNNYVWNELPEINQAYQTFKDMSHQERQDVCDNHIIPRKCEEKQKEESQRISSMRIFIEEVNQY
jgi:hypothetical protein